MHVPIPDLGQSIYVLFVLQLVAGAAIPLFLFSLFRTPLGSVTLAAASGTRSRAWMTSGMYVLGGLAQIYIWSGWAIFCAGAALTYASVDGVVFPGGYFMTALLFVNGPIALLSAWERGLAESGQEYRVVRRRAWRFRFIAAAGFVAYCASPSTLASPYGWFVYDLQAHGSQRHVQVTSHSGSRPVAGAPYQPDQAAGPIVHQHTAATPANTAGEIVEGHTELCHRHAQDPQGSHVDDATVANWCADAAAEGDPTAAYHLAILYAEGRGVARDHDAARRWQQFAEERGVTQIPTP